MKRLLTMLAMSILASSLAVAPAISQGASGEAPGHAKGDDGAATGVAPGQMKGDDESAKGFAPGQTKADEIATAAIGQPNFGTVISYIRAGKSDLSGVGDDPDVTVIEVESFIQGSNRSALENAVSDNQDQIDSLRGDLADLDLGGLSDEDAARAVAAQVGEDGSLTVFVD